MLPGPRPGISPALCSMYICCCGIRISTVLVTESVMMALSCPADVKFMRMWPLVRKILPATSQGPRSPSLELISTSAEKGARRGICADASWIKIKTAAAGNRLRSRAFTKSLLDGLGRAGRSLDRGPQRHSPASLRQQDDGLRANGSLVPGARVGLTLEEGNYTG
jgi:hypothetical protein